MGQEAEEPSTITAAEAPNVEESVEERKKKKSEKKEKRKKRDKKEEKEESKKRKRNENGNTEREELQALQKAYQTALQAFKADKTNKDLRRAKSAAKKAWDDRVIATAPPGAEPLTCRNCSQLFLFTDQEAFAERGWETPTQCKTCTYTIEIARGTSSNRSKLDKKENMCYEFQKSGNCSRGERCKFSHAREHVGKKLQATLDARPLCVSVTKGETCPHGDRCRFRHDACTKAE